MQDTVNINRKIMEQFSLEQINKLVAGCEKIRKDMAEITRQQEAQNDAFEQELYDKGKELSKIKQAISAHSISILEAAFPKNFKNVDLNENLAVICKTKDISFKDDKIVVVFDKLYFSRYGETNSQFSIYKKIDSWYFNDLDEILNYIKDNLQELTEEEYNECKKKIFETASNIV